MARKIATNTVVSRDELLAEELRTLMILAGAPDVGLITNGTIARRRDGQVHDLVPGDDLSS